MIKLKKVILLLVAILLLAFFTGCTEDFMGNDDDDDDDTSDDGNESEEIYRTVTNAMNKAIIAVYMTMDEPSNIFVVLPDDITVNGDYGGTMDVTGSYEITIGETVLYYFDLDITINSYCFNETVVDGTAELIVNMETTVDDFNYSINYNGTGTLLGEASSAVLWYITFIQDSSDAGTVSGYIIIDEVTYNISESITIGVI